MIDALNECLEARVLNLSGGELEITAQDDGLNATDKRTDRYRHRDGRGDCGRHGEKFRGGGGGEIASQASIKISGGVIRIDAEGDGVDSNKEFFI